MLSVTYDECYIKAPYAKCHYTECRGALPRSQISLKMIHNDKYSSLSAVPNGCYLSLILDCGPVCFLKNICVN
jgi:hypothetical protein